MNILHSPLSLSANPKRVVVLPFQIRTAARDSAKSASSRIGRICDTICALTADACQAELDSIYKKFVGRHAQVRTLFLERFKQIQQANDLKGRIGEDHATLIGAYFTHEFSYQAAAVMNPSVVPHPDQTGAQDGAVNFILSTRTVGEGHISTISFREGTFYPDGQVAIKAESDYAVAAMPRSSYPHDGPVEVVGTAGSPISETVIFPITRAQTNGLEDLRMVPFRDDSGQTTILGTYTAFAGRDMTCELFETRDFRTFKLTPLRGSAAAHKGLALFPRKINGRYAAIGRLDHESLYYLESDDKTVWNSGELIVSPVHLWELLQLGNCGSPIELDEGWLVLTHGVGPVRQYAFGAVLLDKADPRKVIGRTTQPILAPSEEMRDGYVPNVLYTCGFMRCADWIFLPYGVADSSVRFASVLIQDILREIKAVE